VLYVLDEPSIGLHQRDNTRLLERCSGLRDLGNTVLVVEHDEDAILTADYVIDIGPAAGVHGGEIVAEGTPAEVMANPKSADRQIPDRRARDRGAGERRPINKKKMLKVIGATRQQPEERHGEIPLGTFTCITGVSGGGKSTFTDRDALQGRRAPLNNASDAPARTSASRAGAFDKVIDIDQSPIGRTPRSNPATYTGAFGADPRLVRRLPEAKARGYGPAASRSTSRAAAARPARATASSRSRCTSCPTSTSPATSARASATTARRWTSVQGQVDRRRARHDRRGGADFFKAVPPIRDKMETLQRVGLGYIKVGQQATTLSGGEAQRVKLSKELSASAPPAARSTSSTSRPPACTSRTSSQAAGSAARAGRPGQHRGRHRAQSRSHQDRRLGARLRSRRRRRRRRDRRRGLAEQTPSITD
jgi:excinuclease ABC subunit A